MIEQRKKIILAVIIMLSGIACIAVQKYMYKSEQIIRPTDNLQVVEILTQDRLQDLLKTNKQPCVLFCYLDGCSWCEEMDPVVKKTAIKPKFKAVQFYKIESNLLEDSELIEKLIGREIDGFPFFVCMDKGAHVYNKDGYLEQDAFEAEIKQSFPMLV